MPINKEDAFRRDIKAMPDQSLPRRMSRETFTQLDDETKFEIVDSYRRTLETMDEANREIIKEKDRQIDALQRRAEHAEQELRAFKKDIGRRFG